MEIELNDGRKYFVKWEHSRPTHHKNYVKDGKEYKMAVFPIFVPRTTTCMIQDVETAEVIASGIAKCGRKDVFNKNEGRKQSLKKALENARSVSFKDSNSHTCFLLGDTRGAQIATRTHIWEKYLSTIGPLKTSEQAIVV